VNAVVAQLAGAVIPEPVPAVMESVFIERRRGRDLSRRFVAP
jgi:hypothetical protein